MFATHMKTQADITMLFNIEKGRYVSGESYKDLRLYTDENGRVKKMEYKFFRIEIRQAWDGCVHTGQKPAGISR